MTVPVWMLLGFAAWTVILLLATLGAYRWNRILTGRVRLLFLADRQLFVVDWNPADKAGQRIAGCSGP